MIPKIVYTRSLMILLLLMAAVLPALAVTGDKTFKCGFHTCSVLKGDYCDEGVCNSCGRFLHNYLDNPNTTMKSPPVCIYMIHYGEQMSKMRDEITMLQTELERKNEWISGMEDNMTRLQTELESKSSTISNLRRLLEDKAKENQQEKDRTNYYRKWTMGLLGLSVIQTLGITACIIVIIVKAAPCRAERALPTEENGRGPERRLVQIAPTEEGRQETELVYA